MEEFAAPEQDLVRDDIHIQSNYRLTEALCESEKRMRRRVELLSEVIFQTNADLTISFLNRAWTNTFGYDVQASLGAGLRDFVAAEDQALLGPRLAAPATAGASDRLELRFVHRNGGLVWMEFS